MSEAHATVPNKTNNDEEPFLFYGRWSVEEERYAEMLIKEFQDGNLDESALEGAPNTLRGFLAHMLSCAPKRVSKKFESTGYKGRSQYVPSSGGLSLEETQRRRETLKALRRDFEARRRSLTKKPTKTKTYLATTIRDRTAREAIRGPSVAVASQEAALAFPVPTATTAFVPPSRTVGDRFVASFNDDVLSSFVTHAPQLTTLGATTFGASAASSLFARAQAYESAVNDILLLRARAGLSMARPSFSAAIRTPTTESLLTRSILSVSSPTAARVGGPAKKRMGNPLLYSARQEPNGATALRLQEQIQQRKRFQEALIGGQRTTGSQQPLSEGPPNKRPRAA